jgi:hypothetical protein
LPIGREGCVTAGEIARRGGPAAPGPQQTERWTENLGVEPVPKRGIEAVSRHVGRAGPVMELNPDGRILLRFAQIG